MFRPLMHTVLVGAVSGVLAIASVAAAQKPSGLQGESYASIAKLPDWSGAWVWPFADFEAELIRSRDPKWANRPRLRPEYEKLRSAAAQPATLDFRPRRQFSVSFTECV